MQLNPVHLHALAGSLVDKVVLTCVKRVRVCSGRGRVVIKVLSKSEPRAITMNTNNAHQSPKEILEAFHAKVAGRLHAFIKETHQGRPAVSCLWNESPNNTLKDVVFVGEDGFDALAVVRATNKSMKASEHVVGMLVEMYTAQYKREVGVEVEF
ncbi:hypothetical protein ACEPU1_33025 [Pseudomonas aeruginosa]